MHRAFANTAHRPWPVPSAPWTWRQSWCDLLFAHWEVPAAVLRPLVPAELELDSFDGAHWIGVVPFRMTGVMRRPLPDLPWLSAFPELNVRTYVTRGGKPGVWFLSLDATNPLAVWAARRFFYLPYHQARMSLSYEGETIAYRSERRGAALAATYRPTSVEHLSKPSTLEHFLTERYCLYAKAADGRLLRNDVHHAPWPLQRAEATIETNTFFEFHGVNVAGPPDHLLFARRLDVVVWGAEHVVT